MIDAKTYAQALYQALSEVKPSDHDKVLDNFVRILAERGNINLYGDIEKEFKKLELQAKGIKEVEITTAKEGVDQKSIVKELNKIVGDKTEIIKNVDEGILGGVVVRVGDTLIDASVKNSLEKLRKTIAG